MTEPKRSEPVRRLSLPGVLTFSAVSLPVTALTVAMLVYLPPYMASHLHVSLGVIGGAWAFVRLLDVAVDPALGVAMDATRTPFGRYRPWTAAGAPILMLATYMLFMAPAGVGGVYLVGWLLVLYLGTSILGLSQSAWGATIATDYHDRSRVFGVLATMGIVGALAVLAIPILARSAGYSDAQAVRAMGWFILITTPLAVALVTLRTPEPATRSLHADHFALADYWAVLIKPDQLRLFLAQMALTLGPGWMSALYIFFFRDSRGFSVAQASTLLAVYVVAGVAGAPLTGRMAMRFGKHRTLMATTTAYSLGLCTLLLIPRGNLAAAVPVMLWCGFMAAGFDLMIRAMLADVGDEIRLEQGKDRTSLLYSLNSLAAKVASAFAIGLTFPLLARLGYDAADGAVNTPQAIRSLEMAYLLGPIVFVGLGGACLLGWRLDAQRHAVIRSELDARDALYNEAPIIESVTGEAAIAVLSGPERRS